MIDFYFPNQIPIVKQKELSILLLTDLLFPKILLSYLENYEQLDDLKPQIQTLKHHAHYLHQQLSKLQMKLLQLQLRLHLFEKDYQKTKEERVSVYMSLIEELEFLDQTNSDEKKWIMVLYLRVCKALEEIYKVDGANTKLEWLMKRRKKFLTQRINQ